MKHQNSRGARLIQFPKIPLVGKQGESRWKNDNLRCKLPTRTKNEHWVPTIATSPLIISNFRKPGLTRSRGRFRGHNSRRVSPFVLVPLTLTTIFSRSTVQIFAKYRQQWKHETKHRYRNAPKNTFLPRNWIRRGRGGFENSRGGRNKAQRAFKRVHGDFTWFAGCCNAQSLKRYRSAARSHTPNWTRASYWVGPVPNVLESLRRN